MSEEVINVLKSETIKAGKNLEDAMRFLEMLMDLSRNASSVSKVDDMMIDCERGIVPKMFTVNDIARNDLYQLFKKNGLEIPIYPMKGNDENVAVFSPELEAKVNLLIKEYMASKGKLHEIPLSDLKDINHEKSIIEFKNLDAYQILKLKEYLDHTGVTYSRKFNGKNNYSVFCSSKDVQKLNQCLYKTMWDLTGNRGTLEKKAISLNLKTNERIQKAIEKGKSFWVVSGSRSSANDITRLHVTPKGYQITDNMIARDSCGIKNKNYDINFALALDEIKDPVFFEEEEMEFTNLKLMEKLKKKNEIGKIERELHALSEKEFRAKQLAEMKMGMIDNSEQLEMISSFYNEEVSFSEFFEIDKVNDEHIVEELNRMDRLEADDEERSAFIERIHEIAQKLQKVEKEEEFIDEVSIDETIDRAAREIAYEREAERDEKRSAFTRSTR